MSTSKIPTSFLSLPRELRDIVYVFALSDNGEDIDMHLGSREKLVGPPVMSGLLACKQIHHEMQETISHDLRIHFLTDMEPVRFQLRHLQAPTAEKVYISRLTTFGTVDFSIHWPCRVTAGFDTDVVIMDGSKSLPYMRRLLSGSLYNYICTAALSYNLIAHHPVRSPMVLALYADRVQLVRGQMRSDLISSMQLVAMRFRNLNRIDIGMDIVDFLSSVGSFRTAVEYFLDPSRNVVHTTHQALIESALWHLHTHPNVANLHINVVWEMFLEKRKLKAGYKFVPPLTDELRNQLREQALVDLRALVPAKKITGCVLDEEEA